MCVLLSTVPFGISISIGFSATLISSAGASSLRKWSVVPVSPMPSPLRGLLITLVALQFISTPILSAIFLYNLIFYSLIIRLIIIFSGVWVTCILFFININSFNIARP